MRILFTSLLIIFFQFAAFSQTDSKYTETLELVKKAFNEKNPSLIHQQFDEALKNKLKVAAFKKSIDSLYENKGTMSSYELILEEEDKNYLLDFENGSLLMVIRLKSDGKIASFEIKEY